MCGIVGLYAKSESIRENLGLHVGEMLTQMGERGPDSAGVAFYSDSVISGSTVSKVCLLYTSPSPRDATLSRMPSSA